MYGCDPGAVLESQKREMSANTLLQRIAEAAAQSRDAQEALFAELQDYDSDLTEQMLEVFGDVGTAMTWFTQSATLGQEAPCCTLARGERQVVVDQLIRMEYGVYY